MDKKAECVPLAASLADRYCLKVQMNIKREMTINVFISYHHTRKVVVYLYLKARDLYLWCTQKSLLRWTALYFGPSSFS